MRWLIWIFLLGGMATGLTLLARVNTGYVLVALPGQRIELSLNFALVLLVLGFMLFYLLVRLLATTLELPARVARFRAARRRESGHNALVEALRARGWTPGVVSRGYRGHGHAGERPRAVQPSDAAAEVGDEPLLITRRTSAPVWIGRRRPAAVFALCAAHPQVDVVISDDGLQHHALHRDAQWIVFDERGVGNGRLLPAGPLREPLPRRLPPGTQVLYTCDAPSTVLPGPCTARQLGGLVPLKDWWRGRQASRDALDALRGMSVHAAAGVGHPSRFFRMLEAAGLQETLTANGPVTVFAPNLSRTHDY